MYWKQQKENHKDSRSPKNRLIFLGYSQNSDEVTHPSVFDVNIAAFVKIIFSHLLRQLIFPFSIRSFANISIPLYDV